LPNKGVIAAVDVARGQQGDGANDTFLADYELLTEEVLSAN
jgi:hypothetical protein